MIAAILILKTLGVLWIAYLLNNEPEPKKTNATKS